MKYGLLFIKQINSTGKDRIVPRPLDVTEDELLSLLKESIQKNIFSTHFKYELKRILTE